METILKLNSFRNNLSVFFTETLYVVRFTVIITNKNKDFIFIIKDLGPLLFSLNFIKKGYVNNFVRPNIKT